MAVRKSKIDYAGRTVDLLLLKTAMTAGKSVVVAPDISTTPMIVTGIEKLVQRYALVFLTELGSVKNMPNEGTLFMSNLGSGRIYNENTLKMVAEDANASARRQILAGDSGYATPDDEALEDSSVEDLAIDRSSATVSVTINITSKAGETFTYVTPIATGV